MNLAISNEGKKIDQNERFWQVIYVENGRLMRVDGLTFAECRDTIADEKIADFIISPMASICGLRESDHA